MREKEQNFILHYQKTISKISFWHFISLIFMNFYAQNFQVCFYRIAFENSSIIFVQFFALIIPLATKIPAEPNSMALATS